MGRKVVERNPKKMGEPWYPDASTASPKNRQASRQEQANDVE